MIQSYSANLNSFGNPRIYGSNTETIGVNNTIINLLYNRFIIESGTKNVVIYIKPVTTGVIDKTNTEANVVTSNTITQFDLSGITISFNQTEQRFEITGDISDTGTNYCDISNNLANLVGSLELVNSSNVVVETQTLYLAINQCFFNVSQKVCDSCIDLTYLDGNYDYQNPLDNYGIGHRGQVEYQYQTSSGGWVSMGTSKIETGTLPGHPWNVSADVRKTAPLSYCFCGDLVNTPLRAIRTIREIPNCGGTSPIIYQSVSRLFTVTHKTSGSTENIEGYPKTLFTSVPYTPVLQVDVDTQCCISEDSEIEAIPLTLTPNSSAPHNLSKPISLEYVLYSKEQDDYNRVIINEAKTGTITVTNNSDAIVGIGTTFTTELIEGVVIYDEDDNEIGTVKTIIDNTNLVLEANASLDYSGVYNANKFLFINPTISDTFLYDTLEKGTYKLIVTYTNTCTSVSKEYILNVCNSIIFNTGECNNPSIQNLSANNFVKFTIKTSNSLDVLDSVSQKVILKDQVVSPLHTYNIPKLDDGFYKIDIDTLDNNGVKIGETETQLFFFDCNIKSCEVYLRSNLLGFSSCVDCADKKANLQEYNNLKLKNDLFQIYKDIIYSYWNDVKKQQSIDDTWDIEDHLQEVSTYSEALKKIKDICTDCGFSFNTNSGTLSSGDCGCGK